MSNLSSENKVLGIPTGSYLKLCYVLILIASGFGGLTNVAGLMSIYIPGGMVTGLIGLLGLALTVTGWVAFKSKFESLEISHFKYLVIIFVIFFLIYAFVVNMLVGMGIVGLLLVVAISFLQFGLLFAGYRLWAAGKNASKDSVLSCMTSGFKG